MAVFSRLSLSNITLLTVTLVSAVLLFTTFIGNVLASSGLVSTIGGATFVQGASQFWVTSTKPTFSGLTTAGATVTGTVGSETVSATADGSGNWSWTPTADLAGDNAVSLTSGSSTATFTLTIGDLPESIASSSASSLAPAGSTLNTLLVIGSGAILIAAGGLGFSKSFRKR